MWPPPHSIYPVFLLRPTLLKYDISSLLSAGFMAIRRLDLFRRTQERSDYLVRSSLAVGLEGSFPLATSSI